MNFHAVANVCNLFSFSRFFVLVLKVRRTFSACQKASLQCLIKLLKRLPFKTTLLFCCCISRTLYCAKGNYEFGISRIMKSLEPYNKKVGFFCYSYMVHLPNFEQTTITLASAQLTLSLVSHSSQGVLELISLRGTRACPRQSLGNA